MTPPRTPPDGSAFVLVFDLETTGLDETPLDASLLEFGGLLCRETPELPIIAEANLVIRPPGGQLDHDRIWAGMPDVARRMHLDNGLWAEATTRPAADSWSAWEADTALCQWLDQHVPAGQLVRAAGSGVSHTDQRWARRHLPQLHERLTYWSYDAGTVRRMLELAGRGDHVDLAGDVDAKPHRALEDARMHRVELVRYLDLLRRLPPPGPGWPTAGRRATDTAAQDAPGVVAPAGG